MTNMTDVHTVAVCSLHTVTSIILVVYGELVQNSSNVVCSTEIKVPVGVNAISSDMHLFDIAIHFIISIITMAPLAVTGGVIINLAYLAVHINEGSRSEVAPMAPATLIIARLIVVPIITPIITARLIMMPIITAPIITPIITAPVITTPIIMPVITARLIATPIITAPIIAPIITTQLITTPIIITMPVAMAIAVRRATTRG
jgi:hypothetical protein